MIRYPLITKNTSTPTNPPLNNSNPAWNKMTGRTARARKPSISARYFKVTILYEKSIALMLTDRATQLSIKKAIKSWTTWKILTWIITKLKIITNLRKIIRLILPVSEDLFTQHSVAVISIHGPSVDIAHRKISDKLSERLLVFSNKLILRNV